MTNEITEFKTFMTWFCAIEEIPLETRYNFLAHILKVGGIDEKAQKFIEDSLERLGKLYENQADQYQKLANVIAGIVAKQKSSQSLKEDLVQSAEREMIFLAEDFKESYQRHETRKSRKEETAEKAGEAEEIAEIKAVL